MQHFWTADAAKTGQEVDAKRNSQFNTAACELVWGTFRPQNP